MAGAAEKSTIQIASFLNVNLRIFMCFFLCLPSLMVGLLTGPHLARLFLTMLYPLPQTSGEITASDPTIAPPSASRT